MNAATRHGRNGKPLHSPVLLTLVVLSDFAHNRTRILAIDYDTLGLRVTTADEDPTGRRTLRAYLKELEAARLIEILQMGAGVKTRIRICQVPTKQRRVIPLGFFWETPIAGEAARLRSSDHRSSVVALMLILVGINFNTNKAPADLTRLIKRHDGNTYGQPVIMSLRALERATIAPNCAKWERTRMKDGRLGDKKVTFDWTPFLTYRDFTVAAVEEEAVTEDGSGPYNPWADEPSSAATPINPPATRRRAS